MILKEEYTYTIDGSLSYTLIDNVDKVDVGCDETKHCNFVKVYKKDRKAESDFFIMWVEDTVIYICNDIGKTLSIIRPYNQQKVLK